MTRAEREQMISRYLGGEMTAAEEQDFFIRVAVDKELRQDLRAHRTVDSALRKDREAESTGHTALRMRVAAVLVATPPAPPAATTPAAPTPGVPSHPMPPAAAPVMGGAVAMKWIAVAVTGVLVTAGALLLPDALVGDRDDARDVAAPAVSTGASATGAGTDPTTGAATAATRDAASIESDSTIASGSTEVTASTATPSPDARATRRTIAPAPMRGAGGERLSTRTTRRGTNERAEQRARTSQAAAPQAVVDDTSTAPTTDIEHSAIGEDSRRDDSIDIGIKLRFEKK